MAAKSFKPSSRVKWLACGLIVAGGCQSTSLIKSPSSTSQQAQQAGAQVASSSASGNTADLGVVRTDFKTDVPADDRVNVHLDLGRAYESQGSFDAALFEYSRALEAANNPARGRAGHRPSSEQKALAHRRIAAALDRMGRFSQAESHYREALALAPKDPRVWNDAGYSAYLQQKWPVAEMRLKTAAKLDPTNTRVHTNLGLCLAATGRRDEALAALTQAAGPAVAHANLGYLLAATGQVEEARKHYQTALTIQPALTAARDALVQLDLTKPAATSALANAAESPADPRVALTNTSAATPAPANPAATLATPSAASRPQPEPIAVAPTSYVVPMSANDQEEPAKPQKKSSFKNLFHWFGDRDKRTH